MIPTREDIEKLARTEPVIYACLTQQIRHADVMTYEQCLMLMILILVEQKKEQEKLIYDVFSIRPDMQEMARRLVSEIENLRSVNAMLTLDKQIGLDKPDEVEQ